MRSSLLAETTNAGLFRLRLRLYTLKQKFGAWLTPRPAWLTFGLLFLSLLMVDASVETAQWVPTPSLAMVTFWGMVTASLLAQLRGQPALLHCCGLMVGVAVILQFTMGLTEGSGGIESLRETILRLHLWTQAAFGGGISSDTLAFGLVLVVAAWMVGYVSAWLVFRTRSIWGGVLPGAVGLLTNLSYLPDRFFPFFFAYVLFAMLLVVWMHSMNLAHEWQNRGISHKWTLSLSPLSTAVWLGSLIVLVAALLPLRALTLDPLARSYDRIRYPVEVLEHQFNRLFSGVPGHKSSAIRMFGSTMPFQGSISLGDVVLFNTYSQHLSYWAARSYSTYTSSGWLDSGTQVRPWGWEPLGGEGVEYRARMDVDQGIELNFATSTIFLGGVPKSVDREASLVVAAPKIYTVDLRDTDASQALPKDLGEWAAELQGLWKINQDSVAFRRAATPLLLERLPEETKLLSADVETIDGRIKRLLFEEDEELSGSSSLRLDPAERVLRAEGRIVSLSLMRQQPIPPDLVAVQSNRRMGSDSRYLVRSSISVATELELKQAGTNYPRWVTDQYLQLPDTLPHRVRQLAEDISRQAESPYDKATRVMAYLRGYEHSYTIEAPSYDKDGVDYFLFEQRKGYSDYFAGAMTVLMRAVGVPAKMVGGYATGVWDPHIQGHVVREKDTHVWTEVFFPSYGWVIFEPTPSRTAIERGVPQPPQSEILQNGREEWQPGLAQDPNLDLLAGMPEDDLLLDDTALQNDIERRPLVIGGMLLTMLVGTIVLWFMLWQRATGSLGSPQRAYGWMSRLAGFTYLSHELSQTPYEFGRQLGLKLPTVRAQVNRICAEYVRTLYGGQEITVQDQSLLNDAWRKVRSQLVRRILHLTR